MGTKGENKRGNRKNLPSKSGGIACYRTIKDHLERNGISLSCMTVPAYMNTELDLKLVSRKRKTNYEYGKTHKVFRNILDQNFTAERSNQKWCTDFTYLYLTNGEVQYNESENFFL